MRRKVAWLSVWVTLVYWLGNAGGCTTSQPEGMADQGSAPRIVLPDEPGAPADEPKPAAVASVDEPESKPTVVAAADEPAPSTQPAPAEPVDTPTVTDTQPEPAAQPAIVVDVDPTDPNEPAPPTEEAPPAPVNETEPSIVGLDRSHWPKITTGPDRGVTYHNPVYFRDVPTGRDDEQVLDHDMVESRINAALSHSHSDWMKNDNPLDLVAQPVKFGLDLLFIPVNMFKAPLWARETSPPGHEADEEQALRPAADE